tara:strand:+ start:1558 stop:1854 length:297 start_codon:yes stop_codon:yes gene_type:complete
MSNKIFSFKNFRLAFVFSLMASCSSEECADCHIVLDVDGTEYELMELDEYCDGALHDVEEEIYTVQDTFLNDIEGNTLPITIFPGDTVEVHCGEEHDH